MKRIFVLNFYFFILISFTFTYPGQTPEKPITINIPKNLRLTDQIKADLSCDINSDESVYLPPTKINEFVGELNRLGKCGYRLEKIAKIPLGTESAVTDLFVFGILKLDVGNKYEYNWFAAKSPGEIVTRANFQAQHGFYLRQKVMFISGRCSEWAEKQKKENENSAGLGDILNLGLGTSGSVFIFERKNGIIKKNEYRVLDGAVERGTEALAKNQKILEAYVAGGFRPIEIFYTGAFDLFTVIMEKDEDLKPEGEYRLFRETYGINKKFSDLGQEGFRPVLVGFYFAILHRTNSQPLNISYESAENYNEITRKLPKWEQKGAIYQATGIADYHLGCDPFEGKLFFSIPKNNKNSGIKKSAYKILEMSDFNERYFKKKDKNASITDPPTTEMIRELQKFLKQGYVIRSLFLQYEIMIILERPQNE